MQTMSTEMATLLKSGKMIGVNKPTHEITIGEGSGGINDVQWEGIKVIRGVYSGTYEGHYQYYAEPGFGGGDFVTRADGKILVTYSNYVENKIYLSVVDSEDDIFYFDNKCAVNEWVFDTLVNVLGAPYTQSVSRFQKLPNGEILLYIMDHGIEDINGVMLVKVYKSANGLGTDFTLVNTLYDLTYHNGSIFTLNSCHLGRAIQLESGRILVPIQVQINSYVSSSAVVWTQSKCFYTDDNWVTFGIGNIATSELGKSLEPLSKGFGNFNGRIYTYHGYNFSGTNTRFSYSDDDGETWANCPMYVREGDGGTSYIDGGYDGIYWEKSLGLNFWVHYEIPAEEKFVLYYAPDNIDAPTDSSIYDRSENGIWKKVDTLLFADDEYQFLWYTEGGNLAFGGYSAGPNGTQSNINGGEVEIIGNTIQAKSITINRSKGMAGNVNIEFDNKAGILAPDGTANPQLLWPNKEIVVKQGYGSELLTTFTGLIDSVSMSTFPQSVTVSARDMMKPLLDHYLRNAEFLYTLTYTNMTVEHIWENLMILAGVEYNIIEETGLTIAEKTFSWETYADAVSWLDEIAGFETYCDEFGKLNFVWDGRPSVVTTAYSFVEGVDITRLGYEINDNDLYYTVAVYGKSPEVLDEEDNVVTESSVIYFARQLPQASYWNIPSGKVMRIDAPEADSLEKCQAIADKAIYLMQTRARQVSFGTIGIPHLQRGDFIQVTESSTTISEIYRITDISTSQDSNGYTMELTCYYHSAPEVVE